MNGPTTASSGQTGAWVESSVDEMVQSLAAYRVVIDGPDHVRAYLQRYPELIPHVLPTVARARQEFGDVAELTLTINDDPECYDPYLKLYVRLPKFDVEADGHLENVAGSLREAIADLEGYFRVAADYRNPAR